MTRTSTITIRTGTATQSFEPDDAPISIGRDPGNRVVVAHASVSSSHADLTFADGVWRLVDHSTYGTFVNGVAITSTDITGDLVVWLANPQTGVRLDVHADPAPSNAPPPPPRVPPAPAPPLPAPSPTPPPPPAGGGLGPAVLTRPTEGETRPAPSGNVLRVTYPAGQTREISPDAVLVIGRDAPDGTAQIRTVATNDMVSRQHAKISFVDGAWLLEDLQSRRGTFVDGQAVKTQKLAGHVTAWLGPESVGEKIVFEAAGRHRKRTSPQVLAGIAAVAVVLVGVVAFAATRGGDSSNAAGNDVTRMKLSTGLVITWNAEGKRFKGSSTVLCNQNLVLTNAHVAKPEAPGQGLLYGIPDDPSEVIYLAYPPADDPDGLAEVKFKAEVLTYDGYADVAVLQIVANASGVAPNDIIDGDPIADASKLDLPCADLPAAGSLTGKSAVDVYGYPGVTASEDPSRFFQVQLDSDSNEVTSYSEDTLLGVRQGWINLGRDIQSGNSGGLVARDNKIYGMPTRGDDESSQARPIDVARPIIEAALAGQEGDQAGYLTPLTGDETASATDADAPGDCEARDLGFTDSEAWKVITWTGFSESAHAELFVKGDGQSTIEKVGRSQFGPGIFGTAPCLAVQGLPETLESFALFIGPNLDVGIDLR